MVTKFDPRNNCFQRVHAPVGANNLQPPILYHLDEQTIIYTNMSSFIVWKKSITVKNTTKLCSMKALTSSLTTQTPTQNLLTVKYINRKNSTQCLLVSSYTDIPTFTTNTLIAHQT